MRYTLLFLFFLAFLTVSSQSKQDYIWLFGIDRLPEPGNQSYRFDFNIKPFEIQKANNGLGINSNNASICDKNGNLLFYTNGCAILNRNAEIMPNGDSINADKWKEIFNWDNCDLGYPGFQDIIILNLPNDENLFYILHKPYKFNGFGEKDSIHLLYTIVDMSLDNGLGDVVEKNVDFYTENNSLVSYLSAIRHQNGEDWWGIQPIAEDSIFLTFRINEKGINREDDQFADFHFTRKKSSASGTAKFSPDGTKYVLYNYNDQLQIYDFDRATGILSNHQKIEIYDEDSIDVEDIRFSSVEWSPNSRFIYTASRDELHQIDTWEDELQDEVRLIDVYDGTQNPFRNTFFLMAQGPDCRIYMCSTSGNQTYHVINKPNEKGLACDFAQNGLVLPYEAGFGSMPNFPRWRVDEEDKCDSTIVSVFGDYVWYRRDLEVYPNPSSGIFNVKMPDGFAGGVMVVTDINGQILYQENISGILQEKQINISNMPTGRYNVEVYLDRNVDRVFYGVQVVKVE